MLCFRVLTDAGAGGLITDASASQTSGTASCCINPGNSGCEFVLTAGKTATLFAANPAKRTGVIRWPTTRLVMM